MPSSSTKQARFMAAAAHDPAFARRNHTPQKVAREFNDADAGTGILEKHMKNRKSGGRATNLVAPAKGGEPKIQIPGDEVMKESKKKTDSFKKGGAVKGKSGGMAEGECAPARMDKMPRKASGGGVSMRGRSPMSSAANLSAPASSGKSAGY